MYKYTFFVYNYSFLLEGTNVRTPPNKCSATSQSICGFRKSTTPPGVSLAEEKNAEDFALWKLGPRGW